jgi:hypothetical protein
MRGQTHSNQRNALQSWFLLKPTPTVLLFGDDPGVKEAAAEYGAVHVPLVVEWQWLGGSVWYAGKRRLRAIEWW